MKTDLFQSCGSHSVMSNSLWLHKESHSLHSPWNSPGQKTGVGKPFLSPGSLPNPGIKPRSPTLQVDSLPAEPHFRGKHFYPRKWTFPIFSFSNVATHEVGMSGLETGIPGAVLGALPPKKRSSGVPLDIQQHPSRNQNFVPITKIMVPIIPLLIIHLSD